MIEVQRDVNEQDNTEIFTTINDLDGTVLGPDALASLTLTLYDHVTRDIINNRSAQDVLNANGGTLTAAGNFTMRLEPDDDVIVGDPNQHDYYKRSRDGTWHLVRKRYKELHVLLLKWVTSSSPPNANKREIGVVVRHVPYAETE